MKKYIFITVFSFIFLSLFAEVDNEISAKTPTTSTKKKTSKAISKIEEDPIISSMRNKMIDSIKEANRLKGYFFEDSFFYDESSDIVLKSMLDNNLTKVYMYDKDKIMYDFYNFRDTNVEIPIYTVHEYFVNLPLMDETKIYISNLLVFKGKCYYFVGAKNSQKYFLLLFELINETIDKPYCLLDHYGEVLYNYNVPERGISSIKNSIDKSKNDAKELSKMGIIKFKFFPKKNNYYLVYPEE